MKAKNSPRTLSGMAKNVLRYWRNKYVSGITIDAPPVFIVGCGHSGTTLLLAILDTHPRIYGIPYESNCVKAGRDRRFRKAQKKFNRLTITAGKRRWVEKTPLHIKRIGAILNFAPDARIILIIRDGRDVAYSIKKRTGSLERGIKRWCEDNRAGEEFWDSPNVHVVKYEDIISDFDSTIIGIMDFLGEKFDSRMKEFNTTKRQWYSKSISKPNDSSGTNHEQYRNWQINQPIFDGRNKWKELTPEELSLINKTAGPMLAKLGYTREDTA